MDNNQMDIQDLISYIHQLQTQNKELQKHIFNIQQQLDEKNEAIILVSRKKDELAEHILKCENQIIKRQARELSLIENIDTLNKELEIYAEELSRVRKEGSTAFRDKEKDKEETEVEKINATPKTMKMPPKSHQKCKNCEALIHDREILYIQFQKERQKSHALARDIECLVGTLCDC